MGISTMKALVSTIEPIDGGVPTMTRWICKLLEEWGITPVLAWYAPWRNHPQLSVPLYKVIRAEPRAAARLALGQYEGYGLGAWFPELEFTHYLPTREWRRLMNDCQLHISVSGNPLCTTPYVLGKVPFLAWVATPWEADRINRVKEFSLPRKCLDTVLNKPVLRRLERRVLRDKNGTILSLSSYTSKEFRRISGRNLDQVMLMPVNTDVFKRSGQSAVPYKIGFSGRYCDPRKNIRLLLHATQLIVNTGVEVELVLVGDKNPGDLTALINEFQIHDNVKCFSHMEPKQLASVLQTLDLFIIPSYQEGLCISALEAMACGVPIISTRCGGPEDYVIPGQTGALIDHSPEALARTIVNVSSNRDLREKLSAGSESWVMSNASDVISRSIFARHLTSLIEKSTPQTNIGSP
jgi:glycosyltransferase involved in cell wall biosynthesis